MKVSLAGRISLPLALASAAPVPAEDVDLWGRWERSFEAPAETSPEAGLSVELVSPGGGRHSVDGFWDGEATWRARFMPPEEGEWRWETRSSPEVRGLHGEKGTFRARRRAGARGFLRHGALRVARSGTHLEHADGTPFFWLGDTCWNGTLLSGKEEWEVYLEDRVSKRFTGIQFNAIAPWRTAPADGAGEVAFTGREDIKLNPRFFRRLDERMSQIEARGLLAAPVLLWSLTEKDPGSYLLEKDIVKIIRHEIARYGAHHVLWILAGDNPYDDRSAERWKKVGRAVFDRPHAPVTTHPTGMNWPWDRFEEERWLDVLGYQSGHGDSPDTLRWIHSGPPGKAWRKEPAKPIINLEPPYEAHVAYQSRRPHPAHNVRRAVYWSLLATPVAGVTYGGHGVWSWHTREGEHPIDHQGTGPARVWRDALGLPGSKEMKHMAALFGSLAWWTLRPDQEILASQPGGDDPARFVGAARSGAGDLAVLYLPVGGLVSLRPGQLRDGLRAEWFDPRTGDTRTARPAATGSYEAPTGDDWVLVFRP